MFPCGQRRGMAENTSSVATFFSSTSARIHMFHIDERSRPPLVSRLSSRTARPSRIQWGSSWLGANVLPMMRLMSLGIPSM